ncbi:hypothetical protein KA005_28260 [bacterium]|nr:hypothetical protein [bacterium]
MEHILPTSHLGVLQAILKELIKAADEDAIFVQEVQPESKEDKTVEIGQ